MSSWAHARIVGVPSLRDSRSFRGLPTAYALGYLMSPLRGWVRVPEMW